MERVIVTGFQPFGDYEFNPVEESTRALDGRIVGGREIRGVVLPCTYFGAFDVLQREISRVNPVAVVSTGLSSSVKGIRLETTGRNIMESKYADADGYSPNRVRIVEDGDEFLNTNSDSVGLANMLHRKGIPVEMSSDADSFVCNSLIYLTSRYLRGSKIRNVFIHSPWTENYGSRIELEKGKIMIPQYVLQSSIGMIVENLG